MSRRPLSFLSMRPAGDYHLLDTCKAVDNGTPLFAPAADLEGTARPQGKGVDIGAYEAKNGNAAMISLQSRRSRDNLVIMKIDKSKFEVIFFAHADDRIVGISIYSLSGTRIARLDGRFHGGISWRYKESGAYYAAVQTEKSFACSRLVIVR